MRKGISLNMVGGLILATVGVAVMLGIYTGTFEGGFQGAFCTTYESIAFLTPGESVPPEGCQTEPQTQYEAVEIYDPDQLTLKLSSAIVQCWRQYENYYTRETCAGWNIQNLNGSIDLENVTDTMQNNDLCPDQIDHTNCGGSDDQIQFTIGSIEKGDIVIIEYNATAATDEQWIEVR